MRLTICLSADQCFYSYNLPSCHDSTRNSNNSYFPRLYCVLVQSVLFASLSLSCNLAKTLLIFKTNNSVCKIKIRGRLINYLHQWLFCVIISLRPFHAIKCTQTIMTQTRSISAGIEFNYYLIQRSRIRTTLLPPLGSARTCCSKLISSIFSRLTVKQS